MSQPTVAKGPGDSADTPSIDQCHLGQLWVQLLVDQQGLEQAIHQSRPEAVPMEGLSLSRPGFRPPEKEFWTDQ